MCFAGKIYSSFIYPLGSLFSQPLFFVYIFNFCLFLTSIHMQQEDRTPSAWLDLNQHALPSKADNLHSKNQASASLLCLGNVIDHRCSEFTSKEFVYLCEYADCFALSCLESSAGRRHPCRHPDRNLLLKFC